jgi:hypothetical protein
MTKNLLIAVAVTFVAGIVLTYLGAVDARSMMMLGILGFAVFSALQMTAGNRKEVHIDNATREAALHATAPAQQALLYVYREGLLGKRLGWNVLLDGAFLAQLRSPRFTRTILNPGSHTLAVTVEGFAASQNKSAQETFHAQAGEVIVFALKMKMGAMSNTSLIVREPDGSAALLKLSKIPMVAPDKVSITTAA